MQKNTAIQLLAQRQCSECVLATLSVTSTPLKFCPHPGLTQEPFASQPSPLLTEHLDPIHHIYNSPLQFSSMPLVWQFQPGIFAQYIHHPSSVHVQTISAVASKYFISKTSNRQMSL